MGPRLKPAPSQALRAPGSSACVCLVPSPSVLMEREFWPFRQSRESWDWDWAWAGRGPLGSQTGPPTLAIQSPTLGLQISCKFPLAFVICQPQGTSEREVGLMGARIWVLLDSSFIQKVFTEHLLYTVTRQEATDTCPVLKLLGYQSPDPLWFLTTNPKYNTFWKRKSVKNDLSRCPCTFILIWFMFFVIEPIYEFGGVQAARMFLVMGPQWK